MSRMRECTTEEKELLRCQTIASQLPFRFENGTEVEKFVCTCALCDSHIPENLIVGKLAHDFMGVISIHAIGYCEKCRAGSPVKFRFYDDGGFLWLTKDGWRRGVSSSRKASVVDIALLAIKRTSIANLVYLAAISLILVQGLR